MFDFGTILSSFGVFYRDDADTGPDSPPRLSARPLSDRLSNKVLADTAHQFGA
jgi:hypothetical protein